MDHDGSEQVSRYSKRLIDDRLRRVLDTLPAVMLVGPRAVGKTTTAARYCATILRLDRPDRAGIVRVDPDRALEGLPTPVLLDEWQEVPAVLGAVKRAVDKDPRPGQFILTGSVSAELQESTWPATGRVVRLAVFPMTQRERAGEVSDSCLLDTIAKQGLTPWAETKDSDLTILDYLDLAARGGLPPSALQSSAQARTMWLDAYVDQLVHRDTMLARSGIDPTRFAAFLEAVALNSAGIVEERTLIDTARINARTAGGYWHLLERLYVADMVPAWWTNRLTRLVAMGKRYLLDTGLTARILGFDAADIGQDIGMLGRFLDSFVAMQLRGEAAAASQRVRLRHLRDKGGRHEIDLICEFPRGRILAIEVKATSSPTPADARHLVYLRDRLGEDFMGGVVFHTGPSSFYLDHDILAAPISALFTQA